MLITGHCFDLLSSLPFAQTGHREDDCQVREASVVCFAAGSWLASCSDERGARSLAGPGAQQDLPIEQFNWYKCSGG